MACNLQHVAQFYNQKYKSKDQSKLLNQRQALQIRSVIFLLSCTLSSSFSCASRCFLSWFSAIGSWQLGQTIDPSSGAVCSVEGGDVTVPLRPRWLARIWATSRMFLVVYDRFAEDSRGKVPLRGRAIYYRARLEIQYGGRSQVDRQHRKVYRFAENSTFRLIDNTTRMLSKKCKRM